MRSIFCLKGDYVQSSEKAWGAGAQIVKVLVSRVGVELRGHGELHEKVIKIAKEAVGNGIRLLW